MTDLKTLLRHAVAEGVALAALYGCSGVPSVPADGGRLDAGVSVDSGTLEPYPVAQITCWGENYGADGGLSGYHGQCCVKASCYTPTDGVCAPTAPGEIGLPPGSGTCGCSVNPQGPFVATQGPYAKNPSHTPNKDGACCYLFGSIGCDGRPLLVDGEALTAEVIHRSDWT